MATLEEKYFIKEIDYMIERLDTIRRLHNEDEYEKKQRLMSAAIFLRRALAMLDDAGDESFYADYKREPFRLYNHP